MVRSHPDQPNAEVAESGLRHSVASREARKGPWVQIPPSSPNTGRVAPVRFIAAVLKTAGPKGSVGSNPTSSSKPTCRGRAARRQVATLHTWVRSPPARPNDNTESSAATPAGRNSSSGSRRRGRKWINESYTDPGDPLPSCPNSNHVYVRDHDPRAARIQKCEPVTTNGS